MHAVGNDRSEALAEMGRRKPQLSLIGWAEYRSGSARSASTSRQPRVRSPLPKNTEKAPKKFICEYLNLHAVSHRLQSLRKRFNHVPLMMELF